MTDNAPKAAPADFEQATAAADQTVASFDTHGRGPLQKLQHFLHNFPTTTPLLVLVLAVLVFGYFGAPRFLLVSTLSIILAQVTIIAMIGVAQTLVILTAGVDLSVGAITVLVTVVLGGLTVGDNAFLSGPLALPVGLAVGLLCGAINGALVTYVRLPPFIVTLGTWQIYYSINLWYSDSATVRAQDVEDAAPILQWFGNAIEFGGARFIYGSVFMVLLFCVAWYVLNWTAWGRHVHAIGDDPEAATLAGIRTRRTLLQVYMAAGGICAMAGWVLIGRIGSISPAAGQSANLDSITAVVIGGTSLFGGRGSIVGTLLGALIVGVFRTGLSISGVEVLWQDLAVGVLSITAVTIDQWIRRVSA